MIRRSLPLKDLAFACGLLLAGPIAAQDGCTSLSQYPFEAVMADNSGQVMEVETCIFLQEYTHFIGIQSGSTYKFTITGNGFITLREGTFDGPVVATGNGYTVYTAASTADLYAHYTQNSSCDLSSGSCQTNTIQMLGDCVPPQVWYSWAEDCATGEFTLEVDLISMGSSDSLSIQWTTATGNDSITGIVSAGTYPAGPFLLGDVIDITVHATNEACDISFFGLAPFSTCPIQLVCGEAATAFNYCYANGETVTWHFQGQGSGSIQLEFLAGMLAGGDVLTIHDGADDTAPVLYQYTDFMDLQLADLTVYSSGPDMYMTLTSDAFWGCTDFQDPWSWEVACLDCTLPQADVTIIEDCDNNQFSIELDVTSIGDGASIGIDYVLNGGAVQSLTGIGVGVTVLGPFTVNDDVEVTLLHENDGMCNVDLGIITDPGTCPTLITCGEPPMNETYCYVNNDSQFWLYELQGTGGALYMIFNSGTIESSNWDQLAIYDGTDNTAPLLWQHTAFDQQDLSGIAVTSLSGSLYVEMTSDGVVSCDDGAQTTWDWTLTCLDCTPPLANVTVVEDCPNEQFSIEVDVTSLGDGTSVGIDHTVNGGAVQSQTGVGTGITILGPFNLDDEVEITLAHEDDVMCNVDLGSFTDSGMCPNLIVCGEEALNESYCYQNNDSEFWVYELVGTGGSLFLQFNSGTIESDMFDHLAIHDGQNDLAPVLWEHTELMQQDLSGISVTSTSGYLFMIMSTDGSVSCADLSQTQWDWTVTCLDCAPAAASYEIVQDCENMQYYVDVNISTIGSDPEVMITNSADTTFAIATAPGTVQVGPFPSGIPVTITLENDSNALCNSSSGIMVNPLCPTIICGTTPFEETYCYGANEDMAWAYEVSAGGTVRLVFDLGTIESSTFDVLTIYDGPDESSPILFQHDSFDTFELGPDGSVVIGPGFNYYGVDVTSTGTNMYMTLTSDGSVQCDSPFNSFDPMEWHVMCVGCAAPGVSYELEPDCEHLIYKAQVDVSELNGPLGLQITEMGSGESIAVTATGTFLFNTFFDLDSVVNFSVEDLDNPGCTYESGPLVYTRDSCIIDGCGIDNYELCYENEEDRWYTYRATADVPVAIAFLQGQMLPGDRIVIYDGADEIGTPVLYQGNNGGNLTGIQVSSLNAARTLTLRIQSNSEGSCADGTATIPLRWDVGCGAVGISENSGHGTELYPNPTNGLVTIAFAHGISGTITVEVLDMSGRIVHQEQVNSARADLDLHHLQNGQYIVRSIAEDLILTSPLQVIR